MLRISKTEYIMLHIVGNLTTVYAADDNFHIYVLLRNSWLCSISRLSHMWFCISSDTYCVNGYMCV